MARTNTSDGLTPAESAIVSNLENLVDSGTNEFVAKSGGLFINKTGVTPDGTQVITNKTVDLDSNTLTNIETDNFKTDVIDTDTTLAADSDTRIASQKATKAYVDASVSGLKWKDPVDVSTTANVTLSGEQTIDGVLTSTSRILVKDQSDATENGLYDTAAGAWSRTSDMDAGDEFPGAAVLVLDGTANASTGWTCTNTASVSIGVDDVNFSQFTGSATYTAGDGLDLTGNSFAVDSTVARLSASQTLTNKTMDAGSNTFSNFEHGAEVDNPTNGVHGVTGEVVGTSDAQTLTNKTIDVDDNTVSNIETDNFKANVIDTDTTLSANSDTRLATQKATKAYADNIASNRRNKDAVDVATTANITLSGEQTIDGQLTSTSRILVKDQTDATENGIYDSAAGAWTRSSDMDSGSEFPKATTIVLTGTTNEGSTWNCTNETDVNIGVDDVNWVQVGSDTVYTAGNGLSLAAGEFSIDTAVTADLSTAQSMSNKTLASPTFTGTVTNPDETLFGRYLRHAGDTDTYIDFTDNNIDIRTGNDSKFNAGSSATVVGNSTSTALATGGIQRVNVTSSGMQLTSGERCNNIDSDTDADDDVTLVTAQGINEKVDGMAASVSDINTGTATDKYNTPDALAGSVIGTKNIIIKVIANDTALSTGDNLNENRFTIPEELDGMNLVSVGAHVYTVSSSGTPTFQVYNNTDSVDMLSTAITIDASEKDSSTATTPPVINTSNDGVSEGDELQIDCDVAGTGTEGCEIRLGFRLP